MFLMTTNWRRKIVKLVRDILWFLLVLTLASLLFWLTSCAINKLIVKRMPFSYALHAQNQSSFCILAYAGFQRDRTQG